MESSGDTEYYEIPPENELRFEIDIGKFVTITVTKHSFLFFSAVL